jgi:hypothetical protein
MDNIVLALIAILIALIVLYYVTNGYLEGTTSIRYNSDMNQAQEPTDVSSSSEFSYGMWVNVNALDLYKTNEDVATPVAANIIMDRPDEMKIYIENGSLKMARGGGSYDIMSKFPLQKWVYINVTLENNVVDETDKKSFINAYIDGKLIKSYACAYNQNAPSATQLSIGQFDAKQIGLKRWNIPLNTKMIADEYDKGSLTKALGNYNLDISVLKDAQLSKRFTIF